MRARKSRLDLFFLYVVVSEESGVSVFIAITETSKVKQQQKTGFSPKTIANHSNFNG